MGLEVGFGIGTMIVFFALIHGLSQYRRRDPSNEPKTEAATRELYARMDK